MFQAPKLTNAGKALYYDNIGGVGITFTTIKMGKGTLSQSIALLTDLIDTVVTINAALSKGGESTYVDISGAFSNAGLTEGFYWKEIGVFAADPAFPTDRTKDILFCYQNAYDTADFIPVATVETVEKRITVPLIVGDADNVSCILDSSLVFATMEDIDNHNDNPSSHSDIRLAVTELEEALADHEGDSVAHITAAERASWNGKPTTAAVTSAIGTHNQSGTAHSDIRQAVAAKASPSDVATAVSEHDQSTAAHSDIRQAVAAKASPNDVATAVSEHNESSGAHAALFKAKADASALTTHTGNETVHITAAERTSWNNKVDKADGTLAFVLGRDASGIYVEY